MGNGTVIIVFWSDILIIQPAVYPLPSRNIGFAAVLLGISSKNPSS
jgi:hypothetical protein